MKNILTLITILSITYCQATNRIVRQDGYLGVYESIQQAIDSANDGDSVIVHPRYDGKYWTENLTINKTVYINSAVDSVRLSLQGNITITPASQRNITIVGLNQIPLPGSNGYISSNTGGVSSTDRTIVNLIDCELYEVLFYVDNFEINIINCFFPYSYPSSITIRHGNIIGSNMYGDININPESSNASSNDTIKIIGNTFRFLSFNSYESYLICNNKTSKLNLYIYNNSSNQRSLLLNNTIDCYNGDCGNFTAYGDTLLIANNIFMYVTTQTFFNGSNKLFKFNACYYCANFSQFTYMLNTITIDTKGRCSSPECIDMGYYLPEYSDIDLTRNDLGTYGGSYSINNFMPEITPGMGKGRIHWLELPRTINSISTPINIKAEGHTNH